MCDVQIVLSQEQVAMIHQSLNEICNGVHIDDWEFETRLGATRVELRLLMDKLALVCSATKPDS